MENEKINQRRCSFSLLSFQYTMAFPISYYVFSTLAIPLFRILRYIHRYKTAKQRNKE